MKLLIDDADVSKIKALYSYYPVDGVTTNPTILAKSGKKPYEVLKEIREFIGENADLHVQVVSRTAEEMVQEAQAYLAAKAGADFAAPYVNRIDNLGADGVKTTQIIHDIFKKNHFKTEVLAASFKNAMQVQELCAWGVGGATVSPDILDTFLHHAAVTAAVDTFTADFYNLCGKGKTMCND